MAQTKNFRHGRIKIVSGDSPTPLVHICDFTEGDFQFTEAFTVNEVRSRGVLRELTRGDDQLVTWSFSAKFTDKSLIRVLRDKVWPAQAATKTGLTASADNTITPAYPFEEGSVEITTTPGTWVKDAAGTTPTVDNHYAEATPLDPDIEGVVRALTFVVQLPSGVTAIDYTFDAVGRGTGTDANEACSGGVKAFDLVFEVFDPCDPPDHEDPDAGTVLETYTVQDAFLESHSFAEADDADTISFAGRANHPKVLIETA